MTRILWALALLYAGCLTPLEKPAFIDDPDQDHDGDGYTERQGDCDDDDVELSPETVWYMDSDGDNAGDRTRPVVQCARPEGAVDNDGDCDDGNPAVHPEASERCNGRDDDCDQLADDDDPDDEPVDPETWYVDADDDGYGDPAADTILACEQPDHAADNADDCNDADAAINPGADEVCDQVDNDCDDDVDDEDADVVGVPTWYPDADHDGYGDEDGTGTTTCFADESQYAPNNGDCRDEDPAVNPAADEICDSGIDNNCDGLIEGAGDAVDAVLYYDDEDGDGYGADGTDVLRCTDPGAGHSLVDGDCDDASSAVNPDADEVCGDGIDNDCDEDVDGADAECGG